MADAAGSKRAREDGDADVEDSEERWQKGPREEPRARLTGECCEWVKGWGFIRRDDLQPNIFVHHTSLEGADSLVIGDVVSFEVQPPLLGERAESAVRVRPRAMAAASAAAAARPARAPTSLVPRSVGRKPDGASGPRTRPITSDYGACGHPG